MQVRLCPKCGSENKPDKASCSGCYASLESVAPTEAKEKPAVQAKPAAQQLPAAQPLSSPGPGAASDGPPTPNYGPPPGAPSYSYGPAPNERRSAPVKKGPNWGAIVLVVLLLGGAAFGGWWFLLKPESPEAVVERFRNATEARDYDGFKSCLCKEDVAAIAAIPGGEQSLRSSWDQAPKQSVGRDASYYVMKTTYENSGLTAVVETKPKDQSKMPPGMATKEILLVQEDGKWKIAYKATAIRYMKKRYPNGIPGMPRSGK